MKKILFSLLLAVIAVGVMSCSNDDDNNYVEKPKEEIKVFPLTDSLRGVWAELMDEKFFFTIDENNTMKYYFDRELMGIGKVVSQGYNMLIVDNIVAKQKDTIYVTHKQGGDNYTLVTLKYKLRIPPYKNKYLEKERISFVLKKDEEIVPTFEGERFTHEGLSMQYGWCKSEIQIFSDRTCRFYEYVTKTNEVLEDMMCTYIPRRINGKNTIYYTQQGYYIWVYKWDYTI